MSVPPPEIERFLDEAVEHRPSGAIGVAAIHGSEIAWTTVAGGDGDTLFQAGSLSKTVASRVALELVERGVLDLDTDLAAGTTLRGFLSHTAGAGVPFYPGYAQDEKVPTLAESGAHVEFDPKSAGRFRYSGGGYTVVQQRIEQATGESFADVARDVVLAPLGMTRSTFEQPPPEPFSAAYADWRIYPESAAAGLWTTPADLARVVCAVQAKPAPMTTPHAAVPRRGQWLVLGMLGLAHPESAGLGLFLRGDRFINLGGAAGSFSLLAGSTENGTGAVVMTAGFRPPFALRALFELEEAQGWRVRRPSSGLLLRAFS